MKRTEKQKFDINPFVGKDEIQSEVVIKRKTIKVGEDAIVIDTSSGEKIGAETTNFVTTKSVERNEFLKTFIKSIGALFNLSNAGVKVYALVLACLFGGENVKKDCVLLNYDMFSSGIRNKVSRRTFSRGVKECVDSGILAEHKVVHYYFINPSFIFNGDRLSYTAVYEAKPLDINSEDGQKRLAKMNRTAALELIGKGESNCEEGGLYE